MSSILRSSKFVRYFVGLARNIVISNRQEVNGGLARSQYLSGYLTSNISTSPFQLSSTLEHTCRRLDEDARRMGRIPLKEVEELLNEIRHLRKASASQSLMVIRCCGNLVPEETPEQRTKLVEEIWNTLENLGVALDISHYNALLKVYLENEHPFSPTEFLAKLEKKGVEPNRVTYQRLIAGYCQLGDINGATKILEFMKEKQLPVSEGIFNALILGHSKADDMESAEGMLVVMKQANLEPSNETYCTLLCGYASRGDKAAVERLISDCKVKDILLTDKDVLEVVYSAAVSGHDELVDEILNNIKKMTGYNQDAANMLLRLVTKGKDEAAYKVFKTMLPPLTRNEQNNNNMSGHLLIKHFVKTNRPMDQLVALCDRLENDGHTKLGIYIAIETSFLYGNVNMTLDLLKVFMQRNQPIRAHYFFPVLKTLGKSGDIKGLLNILKKMIDDFNVAPSVETLLDYYLPYIGSKSPQETVQSLTEIGVGKRQAVLANLLYLISKNELAKAVDLALRHPRINIRSVFLNRRLVEALQDTRDVKAVVSLIHVMTSNVQTEVQREEEDEEEDDERNAIEEIPGRFLISVVNGVQTRELTTEVLKEMVDRGLAISNSCAEIVESRLHGNQLTTEVSDLLAKLSDGSLTPSGLKRPPLGASQNKSPAYLEKIKEKIIANNGPIGSRIGICRTLFFSYAFQGDFENALKAKKEWVDDLKQELTPGWWATLLDLYVEKEDLEKAKECLENIKQSPEGLELDSDKIIKMAKIYIKNSQIDEAISLIKEAKPRREIGYQTKAACWQALNTMAETTQDPDQVKNLLQILVDNKYVEFNNVNLGPVMKAHLLRDDLIGALNEFEKCVKMHRATPWKNELAIKLIEKEDAVNLQTLVDLSTQVHGEINSLYDLVLSFVECGRTRQARKILETPGLVSRNNRITLACERYRKEGKAAPLEGLVEATKDLPYIDRSEIYYSLLETYCQGDNVDKALGLWTQMQDEDVNVSDEFLVKLGSFLKSKGHDVPFEIPKIVAKKEDVPSGQRSFVPRTADTTSTSSFGFMKAIREENLEEALKIKQSWDNSKRPLSNTDVTKFLELLVKKNKFKEAVDFFASVRGTYKPSVPVMRYLTNRISQSGNTDLMNQIGDLLTEDLKKSTSYLNKHMHCAVIAGKGKEELDKVENLIDQATTPDEIDSAAILFPRNGIHSVLESSPSFHEQVTRIVDKYAQKGVTSPANSLCMFYIRNGETEKAKEVYQRYNLSNSSSVMFRSTMAKARIEKRPKVIEDIILLFKDAPAVTAEMKGILYSNLIKLYITNGEAETALKKLEEGLNSITLDNIYYGVLTLLKEKLEAKNIPFNYTIPDQKRTKDFSSSSTSSSSDEKAAVAAKH